MDAISRYERTATFWLAFPRLFIGGDFESVKKARYSLSCFVRQNKKKTLFDLRRRQQLDNVADWPRTCR